MDKKEQIATAVVIYRAALAAIERANRLIADGIDGIEIIPGERQGNGLSIENRRVRVHVYSGLPALFDALNGEEEDCWIEQDAYRDTRMHLFLPGIELFEIITEGKSDEQDRVDAQAIKHKWQ